MKHTFANRLALIGALSLTVGVARAAYLSYEEGIKAARVQFNKGDYAAAQKAVEEALPLAKTPSEKWDGLLRLGLALDKRKLYPLARQQWTKVFQLEGVTAAQKLNVQSMIAGSYGEEENWSQFRIESQKMLDAPGATPQDKAVAHLAVAGSFSNQGDWVAARKELMAINNDPAVDVNTRASALMQVGESYLRDKNFADARATFTLSRDLPGVIGQIRVLSQAGIGETYQQEGNAAQAQREFFLAQVAALEESKRYSDQKQYPSARAVLNQALTFGTVKPSLDAGIRDQIAGLLLSENNPEQARVVLEDLIKRSYPGVSASEETGVLLVKQSAQILIARSYIQQRQTAQAQQVLKALLAASQLDPNVKTSAQKMLDSLS